VSSTGRSSPQRSTTGGSPQPAAPAGAGVARLLRCRGPASPPSSVSGSAASSRAQFVELAEGARTTASPSGPRCCSRTIAAATSTPTTSATAKANAIPSGHRGMPAGRAELADNMPDRRQDRCTMGQVNVRVMPSTVCTLASTS
jgi:hypothetical protein